ncbi:MAG: NAD(P)/FAD-dependent oxidoreductase [Nitrososphaerota archaeon]|nr:NAD(P)/FAD-dependent oxidoreductase [Nitrososphaerota archaeon]MDG6923996.1 NAD(P)/FAD-dependent oxidoreductase [Nitrososphaerota archaeon]
MPSVLTEFDVIVIGGGVNGLTTAAYLAKSGLKTVVIERRDQLGTHHVTEEWSIPGFRTSPHANSQWVGNTPCMLDLDLEKYGLDLYPARYTRAMTFKDGKAMVPDAWDAQGFYNAYKILSEKDARTFLNMFTGLAGSPLMQDFLFAAPSPERFDWVLKEMTKVPGMPEDWWDMTGFEMADYLFEDEHVKTWITGMCNGVGFLPNQKFTGPLGVITLATSFSPNQQAIGGAHQIPHALFRCIVNNGGKVLQSSEVEKIIIENGEAKGVKLGKLAAYPEKTIMARKAIVSNLSPGPTFVDLVGEQHLDKQVYRQIKYQFDYDWGILMTASFMTTEQPKWKGSQGNPNMQNAWMFMCGCESVREIEQVHADLSAGRIPDQISANGGNFVLSMNDKTSVPAGYHNVQFWPEVPYSLRKIGGPEKWDDIIDDMVERTADMGEAYAPGFRKSIKYKVGISPLDTYRKNASALKGVWNGGVSKSGQMYFDRPFLGCNAPRTPIKKLYISNGMWPWGMSWLASGYIAATEIIRDLGMKKPDWWSHKCFEWFPIWAQRNGVARSGKIVP